jgi:hypothetical protein
MVGGWMIAEKIRMEKHFFGMPRLGLVLSVVVLMSSILSCVEISLDRGPVPTPTFPMESLLLDQSAFPEGWVAYEPHAPEDGFGLSVCIHYSPPATSEGGIALHAGYIFRSPQEAANGYAIWAPFWFSDREGWGAWSAPVELPYESRIASQFRFACSSQLDDSEQACQAVGQYGRYMTRFHTFMNPETMTLDDLERILMVIDERMALYLAKDTQ